MKEEKIHCKVRVVSNGLTNDTRFYEYETGERIELVKEATLSFSTDTPYLEAVLTIKKGSN